MFPWYINQAQTNLINCFSSPPACLFYPTASSFITAVINHVHLYFDAKNASYYLAAQQMSLAPQKQYYKLLAHLCSKKTARIDVFPFVMNNEK